MRERERERSVLEVNINLSLIFKKNTHLSKLSKSLALQLISHPLNNQNN